MLNTADSASRRSLVEVMVEFCHKAGFQEESIHDSVQLLDRLIFQNLGAQNLSQIILLAAIAKILINQGMPAETLTRNLCVDTASKFGWSIR